MNKALLMESQHMLPDLVTNQALLGRVDDLQARYPVWFLKRLHHDCGPAAG